MGSLTDTDMNRIGGPQMNSCMPEPSLIRLSFPGPTLSIYWGRQTILEVTLAQKPYIIIADSNRTEEPTYYNSVPLLRRYEAQSCKTKPMPTMLCDAPTKLCSPTHQKDQKEDSAKGK